MRDANTDLYVGIKDFKDCVSFTHRSHLYEIMELKIPINISMEEYITSKIACLTLTNPIRFMGLEIRRSLHKNL